MRAAIVNPYLDTLGGGERYTLGVATSLVKMGYEVDIEWRDRNILRSLSERFGVDVGEINVKDNVNKGDGYDLCFWVSDGSIPSFRARRNFLHFQVPFQNVSGNSLLNKMKFFRVEKVICNSYLTKNVIDEEYSVKSVVIYPPVGVDRIRSRRKKNIILFVGRFSQLKQVKNQHLLIEIFKSLSKSIKDWELVLAGGSEVGAKEYLDKIKTKAKGLNVRIIESPSFKELMFLLGEAKIFWSAVGYGVNENKNPEMVEHFGITVVEAMAAKVVPIVVAAGGHKEIIDNGVNGFLWRTKRELIRLTKTLISDKKLMVSLAKNAHEASKIYKYERFEKEVSDLVL